MSQHIRGQGGDLVFPISPKNTNLVENVEILLPVKFQTDGRRTTCDHNSALEPSAQVH